MTLEDLVHGLDIIEVRGARDIDVQGIAYHSRSVRSGDLFVAIQGEQSDGHLFVGEAIKRGARSVVVSKPMADLKGVSQVIVRDTRAALAMISSAYYGEPSRSLTLVGITGTNGKTTCTYLIESLIKVSGGNPAVIGTINYRYGGRIYPAPVTTPQSLDLQRMMSEMVSAGATHLLMEVSSHALAMARVDGCHFDIALFTNLGRDHLDYHKTQEAYVQSKMRLFNAILPASAKKRKAQVLNMDDPVGRRIPDREGVARIGFSLKGAPNSAPPADTTLNICVKSAELSGSGIRARITTPVGLLLVESRLIGRHNLSNILAAVGVGCALGLAPEAIIEGIRQVEAVPGRLERVARDVFVDYAHTPEALDSVLSTLRPLTQGRIITMFGCGGDRDRGKRAEMGRISLRNSDLVVLTSDNPRTEDPFMILKDIEEGMAGARRVNKEALSGEAISGGVYTVIPDRREAISASVRIAKPGDVVLIAGKGHEDYQIIGRKRVHFDDREEVRRAIATDV